MIFDHLFDHNYRLLERALDYRSLNHLAISNNIANLITPGYRPLEAKFERSLDQALKRPEVQRLSTHPRHIPIAMTQGRSGPSLALREDGIGSADSGTEAVDVDREMWKLSENQLLYQALAQCLSKKFNSLRLAMSR